MQFTPTDRADAVMRRRRKVANMLHSMALLSGLVGLLALCGWILAGPEGALWALAAGAVSLLISPRVSPRMVLGLFGARRLQRHQAPDLFRLVEAIARRAGLPKAPELHCVASPSLNAFAVGSPRRAAIAVTDGLLRALSLRELAGVLAHEMSHVRNNDLFVMGLADTVATLMRLMASLGLLLLLLNLPFMMEERQPVPWALVLILTFAPVVGALLQLALSRTREYDADLDAVHLTGDPAGLASALDRVDRVQGRFWEGMGTPKRRRESGPSILRTHPPTEDRIRRLAHLAPPPPVVPELPRLPLHLAMPPANDRPRLRAGGCWW